MEDAEMMISKFLLSTFLHSHKEKYHKSCFPVPATSATELGNQAMVFAIVKHAALITRQRTCLYSTDTYGDYAMTG